MIEKIDRFKQYMPVLLIFLTALTIRTVKLSEFPPFGDETWFLYWAYILKNNPAGDFFISISADGYPPFFTWISLLIFDIFSNPYLGPRLISAISGSITAIVIYKIGKKIFSNEVGFISGLLVALAPLFFFFDRMAAFDSLMAVFASLVIYYSLSLVTDDTNRRHLIVVKLLLISIFAFFAIMTKTTAFTLVAIPFLAIVSFRFDVKKYWHYLPVILIGPLFAAMILYSHPDSWVITKKAADLSLTSELFKLPTEIWIKNLGQTVAILNIYLGAPYIILVIVGMFTFQGRHKTEASRFLLAYHTFYLLFFLVISAFIHSRYLAFVLMLTSLPVASSIIFIAEKLKERSAMQFTKDRMIYMLILFLIAVLPSWSFFQTMITSPMDLKLVDSDQKGYVSTYFSGVNYYEIADWLDGYQKQRNANTLIIVRNREPGAVNTLLLSMKILLRKNPNLFFIEHEIYTRDPGLFADYKIEEVIEMSQSESSVANKALKLLSTYSQRGRYPINIYEVRTD